LSANDSETDAEREARDAASAAGQRRKARAWWNYPRKCAGGPLDHRDKGREPFDPSEGKEAALDG